MDLILSSAAVKFTLDTVEPEHSRDWASCSDQSSTVNIPR